MQQLNELQNGMSIGGVAPTQVRHFEKFRRVTQLLRSLQEEGQIQLSTLADEERTVALTSGPLPFDAPAEAKAAEVISLLGLTRDAGPIPVEAPTFPRGPATIVLTGRSFLGVMTFLAQLVEVPREHVQAELVRVTKGQDGKPFDWHQISGGLFRVRSGESEPERAYVRVQYRGYWFWIDDADLEAKGTFTLLSQLFSLQAASDSIQAPMLTIPAR